MPETITWGHGLMLAGLFVGLFALVQFLRWFRHREHNRGTPQYADARLARRAAVYALTAAVTLFVAGCLTPLCKMSIA